MSTEFEAMLKEKWAISKAVLKKLSDNALLSEDALGLISEGDLKELELKKGEFLLLRKAASDIQQRRGDGPLVCPASEDKSQSVIKQQLDAILASPDKATTKDRLSGGRVDLDPSFYLAPASASGECAMRIVDFISNSARDSEEIDLGGGISLKLAGQKPKLDKVSPAMWMAANGRIMAHLISTGDLDADQTLDYISYTIKIGELACRYTWASVLVYDDEYRTLQAAGGFRWGADTPHLSTVLLREKTTALQRQQQPYHQHQQQQQQQYGGFRRRPTNSAGKEYCLQYNRGNCTYGNRCNFSHSCLTCGKADHPAKDHLSTGDSKLASSGASNHQ